MFAILLALATVSISAQNVAYTYDNAGNRTARTVGAAKAPQTTEVQQTVTALTNPVTEKDISVYPNPTQGHFTVNISNISHENMKGEVILYDMSGKLLEKKNIHSHAVDKKLTFNISHKSQGTYTLNIRIGENTFTRKIIKK